MAVACISLVFNLALLVIALFGCVIVQTLALSWIYLAWLETNLLFRTATLLQKAFEQPYILPQSTTPNAREVSSLPVEDAGVADDRPQTLEEDCDWTLPNHQGIEFEAASIAQHSRGAEDQDETGGITSTDDAVVHAGLHQPCDLSKLHQFNTSRICDQTKPISSEIPPSLPEDQRQAEAQTTWPMGLQKEKSNSTNEMQTGGQRYRYGRIHSQAKPSTIFTSDQLADARNFANDVIKGKYKTRPESARKTNSLSSLHTGRKPPTPHPPTLSQPTGNALLGGLQKQDNGGLPPHLRKAKDARDVRRTQADSGKVNDLRQEFRQEQQSQPTLHEQEQQHQQHRPDPQVRQNRREHQEPRSYAKYEHDSPLSSTRTDFALKTSPEQQVFISAPLLKQYACDQLKALDPSSMPFEAPGNRFKSTKFTDIVEDTVVSFGASPIAHDTRASSLAREVTCAITPAATMWGILAAERDETCQVETTEASCEINPHMKTDRNALLENTEDMHDNRIVKEDFLPSTCSTSQRNTTNLIAAFDALRQDDGKERLAPPASKRLNKMFNSNDVERKPRWSPETDNVNLEYRTDVCSHLSPGMKNMENSRRSPEYFIAHQQGKIFPSDSVVSNPEVSNGWEYLQGYHSTSPAGYVHPDLEGLDFDAQTPTIAPHHSRKSTLQLMVSSFVPCYSEDIATQKSVRTDQNYETNSQHGIYDDYPQAVSLPPGLGVPDRRNLRSFDAILPRATYSQAIDAIPSHLTQNGHNRRISSKIVSIMRPNVQNEELDAESPLQNQNPSSKDSVNLHEISQFQEQSVVIKESTSADRKVRHEFDSTVRGVSVNEKSAQIPTALLAGREDFMSHESNAEMEGQPISGGKGNVPMSSSHDPTRLTLKKRRRRARAALTQAWWDRELKRRHVGGSFSLEKQEALEAATEAYNQKRDELRRCMYSGELTEEDAQVFPRIAPQDCSQPRHHPVRPQAGRR